MSDSLPTDILVGSPDGRTEKVLSKGAALPAQARAVFATQKAGERELALQLFEGAGKQPKLIGDVTVELPAGLPHNTWLAVFIRINDALGISIEVTENLRRLRLEGELDTAHGKSKRYH